ncbi:hypothetical protein Bca101_045441 [Brassica carinata]
MPQTGCWLYIEKRGDRDLEQSFEFCNCFQVLSDPSDPDPVMAGAVARILKREKQFAWLDEQEKRVNATVADMRARGIIRDR